MSGDPTRSQKSLQRVRHLAEHREPEDEEARRAFARMDFPGYTSNKEHHMIKGEDVHNGSLGVHIDAMIGTCPIGAPAGFTLRKMEYKLEPESFSSNTPGACFIATYRQTERHIGTVVSLEGADPASAQHVRYRNLNKDSSLATAGEYDAQKPHRLTDGDRIVATILRVSDGRPYNKKSGHIVAGIVPCADPDSRPLLSGGSKVHYGAFTMPPSTSITGNAFGGSTRVACSSVDRNVAIVQVVEDISYMKTVNREQRFINSATDMMKLGEEDAATPVMAIVVEGFEPEDAPQFQVMLTTYALVGMRDDDHSHAGRSLTTNLKDFTCLVQKSPVYVM